MLSRKQHHNDVDIRVNSVFISAVLTHSSHDTETIGNPQHVHDSRHRV